MTQPEAAARENIDRQLVEAGWVVQDFEQLDLYAGRGIAMREFPLKPGHGRADYLLYVDRQAVGIIEAKAEGATLTGVEVQTRKYGEGLPDTVPAPVRPLPFLYQSTGVVTRFTNRIDPEPRSRPVFAFHRTETLAEWIAGAGAGAHAHARQVAEPERGPALIARTPRPTYAVGSANLRRGLLTLPPIADQALWPAQLQAIRGLEHSLAENRPRALIQMATGSGKMYTAVSSIYRLIKHAGAGRALFLVDRANLGRQAKGEFDRYRTPDDDRTFAEIFNVQHLASNKVDDVARVCIATIQRLYSMLKGEEELPEEADETSLGGLAELIREPVPVAYNAKVPIEFFDVIFIDECHRSIYTLWKQVLDNFDACLVGVTATPSKQTFGFFDRNLVMEYGHAEAVADHVNVDFDVYRIRTKISEGSRIEAGHYVDYRDRDTRQRRPLPEDIVGIVRQEFGRGNDFARKITCRTTGRKPEELIAEFRNSYNPRIAVTVDMIATGTDIRPLEVVVFMRDVKSRVLFEQMKGRGVRVIAPDDLKSLTSDAEVKMRFVIVDCVGVCEKEEFNDSPPLERKPTVSLDKLLRAVAMGSTDPDVVSTLASRLSRLDLRLEREEKERVREVAGGRTLQALTAGLVRAIDPDAQRDAAREEHGLASDAEPAEAQLATARDRLIGEAVRLLASSPALRELLVDLKRAKDQIIDVVSQDEVLEVGFSASAKEKAKALTASFERFLEEHRDEITALQLLHGSPARVLTNLVSLVRFAMHRDDVLEPFPKRARERFEASLADQECDGRGFTDEQRLRPELIRDHVAANTGDHARVFRLCAVGRYGLPNFPTHC